MFQTFVQNSTRTRDPSVRVKNVCNVPLNLKTVVLKVSSLVLLSWLRRLNNYSKITETVKVIGQKLGIFSKDCYTVDIYNIFYSHF